MRVRARASQQRVGALHHGAARLQVEEGDELAQQLPAPLDLLRARRPLRPEHLDPLEAERGYAFVALVEVELDEQVAVGAEVLVRVGAVLLHDGLQLRQREPQLLLALRLVPCSTRARASWR